MEILVFVTFVDPFNLFNYLHSHQFMNIVIVHYTCIYFNYIKATQQNFVPMKKINFLLILHRYSTIVHSYISRLWNI